MKWFSMTLMMLLIVALGSGSAEADSPRVGVLLSNDNDQYMQLLNAFKEDMTSNGVRAEYEIFPLQGNPGNTPRALRAIQKFDAHLILTIGALATEAVSAADLGIPIIAGMVLRPEVIKHRKGATGVYLEYPIDVQLTWIRRILPDVKRIGVIYSSKENEQRIARAREKAREMGLHIKAYKVKSAREISVALKKLSKDVDAFWGLPDKTVLTSQTAKHILLYTFRKRIPFIGLSSAWVKAGAVYALEWDYVDLGKQSSEIAIRILNGEDIGSIPPVAPRKILFSVNQKTAQRMKLDIPARILTEAQHVF